MRILWLNYEPPCPDEQPTVLRALGYEVDEATTVNLAPLDLRKYDLLVAHPAFDDVPELLRASQRGTRLLLHSNDTAVYGEVRRDMNNVLYVDGMQQIRPQDLQALIASVQTYF